MVYDTMTARSMDITSSIEKRQSELRHLYQRLGNCHSDELRPSTQSLQDQKRRIESSQQTYEHEKTTYDGYIKQAQADKETAAEIQRRRHSFDQGLNERLQTIDQAKRKYESALKEHQANYQRADGEALAKRKWFDENTITVLDK